MGVSENGAYSFLSQHPFTRYGEIMTDGWNGVHLRESHVLE